MRRDEREYLIGKYMHKGLTFTEAARELRIFEDKVQKILSNYHKGLEMINKEFND